jgi:hypothetical protein
MLRQAKKLRSYNIRVHGNGEDHAARDAGVLRFEVLTRRTLWRTVYKNI